MIRSEGSTPFEYARESGDYQPRKILEVAEMVGGCKKRKNYWKS